MREIIQEAVSWLKDQDTFKGCLTGSHLLDYFPGQDIDVFAYSEADFTKMLYAMYYNPMTLLLDPTEKWKFSKWTSGKDVGLNKIKIVTIKFKYNLSVDINLTIKKGADDIFKVLSSFDMDLISVGYDFRADNYLDLSGDSKITKIADWNKWNPAFYSEDQWSVSRLLRQFIRCVKYHQRGYNTDNVVLKYKELIGRLINYENIFKSESWDENIKEVKANAIIVDNIFNLWLSTHEISDEELEILNEKLLTMQR